MTLALLFLLTIVQATPAAPGPDSLRAVAMHGSDAVLRASVRDAPAQARDAVSLLLASATLPDSNGVRALHAAARLADAIAAQLGDSFPRSQVTRYAGWTVAQRRQKVVIDSLRRAGNAAMGRAGFARALVLWQASARRASAMHDSAGLAAALGNIGTGYYRAGELDSAAIYYARAATLAGGVADQRTALNALGGSAGVALERGDLRVAQQLFDSALALRARIGDVRGMAADRNNIGALNERLGDMAGARDAYLAALAIAEQYGMDEPAAVSLLNLGKLASLRAEFAEADLRYAAARMHYEAAANRPGQALVFEHLGLLKMRQGDYAAAARRFRSGLAIYRETGPASSIAEVRAQLARALAAAGALDQARVELERARSEANRDPQSSAAALVELAAADLAIEFNSYDEAELSYRKAEWRYHQAGDGAGRAQARQGLAYLQLVRDEPAAAAATLEPVVVALDLSGAHRDAALARVDLAFAYAGAGRAGRARAELSEARDTLRRSGDVVGEAAALVAMGDLERGGGRPVAAMTLYEEGLQILQGRQAPNVEWQLRAGLADAMADQKAPAAAAVAMRQAVAVLDGTALRIPAEQRRSRYLADKWYAYDRLARLEAQLGRDSTALEVSERMRAREMRDALARGRIPWRADGDSALVRQEQELRHAITQLAAEVDGSPATNGMLRGPSAAVSTPGAALEALAQAESRYAELLTALRDRQPAYARLVTGPSAGWREVAGALSADAALLEYLVSDSAAMLFVVTRGGVRSIDLATDRAALAPLIDFARGAIAATRNPGAAPDYRAPLRALHAMLVAPVEASGALQGIRTLIIAPQAELHYLPFAALLEPGAEGK
ncbi:MAG: tetratricopeptide repeat domain protein, partial [Gemmatimonadetes bacterium]|nr:tetratricopeptide repeat domain protein [Gemmatimonadota bacterium]